MTGEILVKPPLLLRLCPEFLRGPVWYRVYRGRPGYDGIFKRAEMRYAKGYAMHDLVTTDYISECVAFMGFFELWLSRRVRTLASAGGAKRLVDVGANMGYFSLVWLAAGERNEVLAFEPDKRNLVMLRKNLAENGCEARCVVHPLACSDQAGVIGFDSRPQEQTGWGSIALTDESRVTQIEAVRLDQIIDDDRPIDLLKIDTEGADYLVLKGCEKLLRSKQIKEIVFEMNEPGMAHLNLTKREVLDYLKDVGYPATCVEKEERTVSTWRAVPL